MSKFLNEIEIEVPVSSCVVSDIHLTPYSSSERLQHLSNNYNANGTYPFPHARQKSGLYEIVCGWEVVEMLRSTNSRIRLLCAEYSDQQAVNLAIVEQARNGRIHWLDVTKAILKIKNILKWSDETIADALDLSRSNVTKQIQVAKKLRPYFGLLAKRDELSFTLCRQLAALSATAQQYIEEQARAKGFGEQQIKKLLGEKKKPPAGTDSEKQGTQREKSIHIKRLETQLSESIGFPITINESTHEQGGCVEYQFFSRVDMIEVLTQLRKGFSHRAVVTGKIVLEYADNDRLDQLIGGLQKEENW